MENYTQSQRERLNYLEFRILFTGEVSRGDLVKRFGIQAAAATRDFAKYRKDAPGNIELDNTSKIYRICDSFMPKFINHVDSKSILRALIHGIGDDFGVSPEHLICCELPTPLHAPEILKLAVLSRAIYNKSIIEIEYHSYSGFKTRRIAPFALAGNGLRWHIRAYDRLKNRFADFVINRIQSAKIIIEESPKNHELKESDEDWNRIVNLEIVAHPNCSNKKMIELEFAMTGGVLKHKARAAMVGYILNLWNVDCSKNHDLKNSHSNLWLRNSVALYGINNAISIAPGYIETD